MEGKARLIRSVAFRATHHYARVEWTDEENLRAFGEQTRAHTHDWRVELHVAGPVDPHTGWCVDLGALDGAAARTMEGWDGGDLNVLIPDVAQGMTPSTENLARWLYLNLSPQVPPPAELLEVRVYESPELGSVYPG